MQSLEHVYGLIRAASHGEETTALLLLATEAPHLWGALADGEVVPVLKLKLKRG